MKKKNNMKFDNFKILDYLNIFGDFRYIKDLSVVLKSKNVSFFKKLFILSLLLLTLIYVILPMGIIPNTSPGFGLIEDIIVGAAMFVFIGTIIGNEIKKIKAEETLAGNNKKSKIVKFENKTPPRDSGPNNKIN